MTETDSTLRRVAGKMDVSWYGGLRRILKIGSTVICGILMVVFTILSLWPADNNRVRRSSSCFVKSSQGVMLDRVCCMFYVENLCGEPVLNQPGDLGCSLMDSDAFERAVKNWKVEVQTPFFNVKVSRALIKLTSSLFELQVIEPMHIAAPSMALSRRGTAEWFIQEIADPLKMEEVSKKRHW